MKKKLLDKAPEIVAALRCCGNTDTKRPDCDHCPLNGYMCVKRMLEGAAALIEAYAAQLAAVTAERDAAVESWRGFCSKCEWRDKQYLADGKMDDRCKTCRDNHKCNWKWRGPQGAGEVGHAD